jgi:hypothetical protein
MAKRPAIISVGVVLVAGLGGYVLWRSEAAPPIVGVVRITEIRVAPEVGGQLAASRFAMATASAPAMWSPSCRRSS